MFGIVGGIAPLAFFLDRPQWLAWAAVVPVLFAAGYMAADLASAVARPLNVLEFLTTAGAAIFEGSAVSIALLGCYGTARAIFALAATLSVHVRWDPIAASRNVTVLFSVLLLFGNSGTTADLLRKRLFPRTGIGNGPLYPGLTWRSFAVVALPAVAVAVGLTVLGIRGWWPAWILLTIAVATAAAPAHTALESQDPPPRRLRVGQAVAKLLEACGYTTICRLQTGEREIDRIIAVYDLLAHRDGNVLAIHWKIGEPESTGVAWTEVPSLRAAVWAVYKAAARCGCTGRSVTPVLILAGRSADDSLVEFAREESIRIIEIRDAAVIDGVVEGRYSPDELRQLSQTVLGLTASAATAAQERS